MRLPYDTGHWRSECFNEEMAPRFRIVIISQVLPIVEPLVPYLRELGHEPVAWLMARRESSDQRPLPPWGEITDTMAPAGLSLLFAPDKHAVEALLRGVEPDLVLCAGFPWKLPQAALDVARLGSVNEHPALLPRHRGPIPLAWALREGDGQFGVTWHRMDAELDTGAILAQTTVPIEDDDSLITDFGPKLIQASFGLLPRVLERVAAGDPGDAQTDEGASWAAYFDEDYATVDWTQPARKIHDQVRAWHLTFGLSEVPGPIAELDGERVKLLRTSLKDPGSGARAVECGEGTTIWIVESEPAP
jgi:methionyl-tRNA formyltransferase